MQSRLNSDSFFDREETTHPIDHNHKRFLYYSGRSTLAEEVCNFSILKSAWIQGKYNSPTHSVEKIALYCYTLDDELYKELNRLIREWFAVRSIMPQIARPSLFPLINYVKTLISQVEYHEPDLVLYRGVANDRSILAKVGETVYSNQFESSSLVKSEAVKFVGQGTLYSTSTKFAIHVGPISKFPHEKEYIVPPGVNFVVRAVRPKNRNRPYHEVDIDMIMVNCKQPNGRVIQVNSTLEFINTYLEKAKAKSVPITPHQLMSRIIGRSSIQVLSTDNSPGSSSGQSNALQELFNRLNLEGRINLS